jgi:hypothetical protein
MLAAAVLYTVTYIRHNTHLLALLLLLLQVYAADDITFRGKDYPRTLHLQDYSVEFPRHYNGGYSLVRQLAAVAFNNVTSYVTGRTVDDTHCCQQCMSGKGRSICCSGRSMLLCMCSCYDNCLRVMWPRQLTVSAVATLSTFGAGVAERVPHV